MSGVPGCRRSFSLSSVMFCLCNRRRCLLGLKWAVMQRVPRTVKMRYRTWKLHCSLHHHIIRARYSLQSTAWQERSAPVAWLHQSLACPATARHSEEHEIQVARHRMVCRLGQRTGAQRRLWQQLTATQQPDAYVIDSSWLRSEGSQVAEQLCQLLEAAGYVRHVSTATQLAYSALSPAASAGHGAFPGMT